MNLKSLIEWIKRCEADGVTKIDGIGTQMHISCYMNPTTQASKMKAIDNMLKHPLLTQSDFADTWRLLALFCTEAQGDGALGVGGEG